MVRYIIEKGGVLLVSAMLAIGLFATAGHAVCTDGDGAAASVQTPESFIRVAQNRDCAARCAAQCRSAAQGCSGSSCSAQYQICVRQCVVACGR